jgi:hypothetical protein
MPGPLPLLAPLPQLLPLLLPLLLRLLLLLLLLQLSYSLLSWCHSQVLCLLRCSQQLRPVPEL